MSKLHLKVKQISSIKLSTGKQYTIYRVFNIKDKYFNGFAVDSDSFKKHASIDSLIQYARSINCNFTADKIQRIIKGS